MTDTERIATLQKKALSLPKLPGVYIMKGKDGGIIYIGKAKVLKNRVSQYFTNIIAHTEKVRQMVLHAFDFEYIICDSEFEALVLENSLIKQNQPKYNILLKDDKGSHYVHVTNEEYPRITAEKQQLDGGRNIGPYNSGYIVSAAVDEAKKAFGLPLCKKVFKSGMKKQRPCLNYFIGLCRSPCSGKMSKEEYLDATERALDLIKNGAGSVVSELKKQMEECSERLEFEKAAYLRDRISAIEKIGEKQKVVLSHGEDMDVIACVDGNTAACCEVFRYRGGLLADREHFFIDKIESIPQTLSEFIPRYYSMRRDCPKNLLLETLPEDAQTIEEYLSSLSGRKVSISVPQRGDKAKLLSMCRTNCAERLVKKQGGNIKTTSALDELKTMLSLQKIPEYIEAYDISHTAGEDAVGGMVVFKNGVPLKKAYRKFAINGIGNDDYASMAQVITRRIGEYRKNKDGGDEFFGRLPDLILLDGGAGQLSAVLDAIPPLPSPLPIFGMVKDDKHRTRALVGPGGEIQIKATRSVYTLISSIQDEVHRFAIGYHHKKHKKRTLTLSLTQVDGIGKTRAAELIKHFGDINKIAVADIDELKKVPGMNERSAKAVFDFYHNFGENS